MKRQLRKLEQHCYISILRWSYCRSENVRFPLKPDKLAINISGTEKFEWDTYDCRDIECQINQLSFNYLISSKSSCQYVG